MSDFGVMVLPDYFKNLIESLQRMPGVGSKTAFRLAVYLVSNPSLALSLANSILDSVHSFRVCSKCGVISDSDACGVCDSASRDKSKLCVIENLLDFITLESAGFYKGLYHILGGLISPLDNVDESKIRLNELYSRVDDELKEIIFALPSTLEAESTFLLIRDKLKSLKPDLKLSRIAVGLPVGSNIDYIDRFTLMRSFENRTFE